jgi:predicted nucleic acid-binding protein
MNNQYMIDTSVWIDYFRDANKKLNDFIDHIFSETSRMGFLLKRRGITVPLPSF